MIKKPNIRFASINDLPLIVEIYNQAIGSKSATGDMDAFLVEDRVEWFQKFDTDSFPIYVAEINDKVIGYLSFSSYREGRRAMSKIAEISFYLDYSCRGLGIGSVLVGYAINDCKRIGKETLLAILLDINTESVKLLKKFNFEKWGHLPDVVSLEDQKCGQFIYGLSIKKPA
jgi:phosphinothricin acetyltransferase